MQAIIETGGKQYKVSEGSVIYAEKLEGEAGDKIVFDRVLAVFEGEKLKIGTPYVAGITIEGKLVKQDKNRKVKIFKMNPKKTYRKRQGHRQPYTKIQIEKFIIAV